MKARDAIIGSNAVGHLDNNGRGAINIAYKKTIANIV
jgi:hypothetical protein